MGVVFIRHGVMMEIVVRWSVDSGEEKGMEARKAVQIVSTSDGELVVLLSDGGIWWFSSSGWQELRVPWAGEVPTAPITEPVTEPIVFGLWSGVFMDASDCGYEGDPSLVNNIMEVADEN
jgi:hypothetical protein